MKMFEYIAIFLSKWFKVNRLKIIIPHFKNKYILNSIDQTQIEE